MDACRGLCGRGESATPSNVQAVATQGADFDIRTALPADRSFILATWLNGHRHGSAFASRLTNETYFPNHHAVVEAILGAPDTKVFVACHPEDQDVIFGYLVTEGGSAIHWAHVKREFRRAGLLRSLIAASAFPSDLKGIEYSHDSRLYRQHLEARFPEAGFNPYLALRPRR